MGLIWIKRGKELHVRVWTKLSEWWLVLVDFCCKVVVNLSKRRYKLLKPPLKLDSEVELFVDRDWMEIVLSQPIVRTSDFFLIWREVSVWNSKLMVLSIFNQVMHCTNVLVCRQLDQLARNLSNLLLFDAATYIFGSTVWKTTAIQALSRARIVPSEIVDLQKGWNLRKFCIWRGSRTLRASCVCSKGCNIIDLVVYYQGYEKMNWDQSLCEHSPRAYWNYHDKQHLHYDMRNGIWG